MLKPTLMGSDWDAKIVLAQPINNNKFHRLFGYGLLGFASMSTFPKSSINCVFVGVVDTGLRRKRHACKPQQSTLTTSYFNVDRQLHY